MTTKKTSKTHTSTRSKKKSSTKASKARSKRGSKRKSAADDLRELQEMTLKMAQMVYDDYQQGKMRLLF